MFDESYASMQRLPRERADTSVSAVLRRWRLL